MKLGEPLTTRDFLSQVAIETKQKYPVDLRCHVSTVKRALGIALTIKDVLRASLHKHGGCERQTNTEERKLWGFPCHYQGVQFNQLLPSNRDGILLLNLHNG